MFEFILRKTLLKNLSEEDQNMAMLQKQKFKMRFISQIFVTLFGILPLAVLITSLITSELTLSNVVQFIILILAYAIYAVYFVRRFNEPIEIFKGLIAANMYSSRYVLKGNAISKDDFDIIKKEKEMIYYGMMKQRVNGYCYHVCFEILKCLKKGTIQFVAVKRLKSDKTEQHNEYTMHVLYVNNNWCYDTYSERQYPLEEVMSKMKAKTYRSFSYADVDRKTYEEFREEHSPALIQWCKENNCYQKWR